MTHAIVTGASQGLGRAIALHLARQAIHVHVVARNSAKLAQLVDEIRASGGSASPYTLDMTATQEYGDALTSIAGTHEVKHMVCSGGGPKAGNLDDLTHSDWDQANRLLLSSTVAALSAVSGGMVSRGYGRIVVVGSSAVRQPIGGLLLSNVYRAGVLSLVKSIAGDLIRAGVTINMASPGRFDTDRVRALDSARAISRGISLEEERAASVQRIPAGRYGRPEEFASLVSFLLSPDASYLTGQNILLDGGLVTALP